MVPLWIRAVPFLGVVVNTAFAYYLFPPETPFRWFVVMLFGFIGGCLGSLVQLLLEVLNDERDYTDLD